MLETIENLLIINFIAVIWCKADLDYYIRRAIWEWCFKGLPFNEDFLIQPLKCS